MEIVVCVKRVSATDTKVKVAADGRSLDPAGVEFVLNPYDEIAIEQALQFREKLGAGSVTAVTLGGQDSQKELRTCLAMGADKAVLLDDGGKTHDAFATAKIVAEWIKTVPHDLVLCGRQAVDFDDAQFPARVAALLDLPCVTEVAVLELTDKTLRAERDIEGAREIVACPLPCVVSANKGLNEPRYASLKGIMAAKKKPLDTVPAAEIASALEIVALTMPPDRPAGRILASVDELVTALRNEAKVI